MFWAFFTLLMLVIVIGVVIWFGWQRVSEHLKKHPEAAKLLAEHVLMPLLVGEVKPLPPKPQLPQLGKPEPQQPAPKKIKGATLV